MQNFEYLYLKQKVFSIGDKFTFYNQNQSVIFTAKGSLFRIPKRFQLFANENPIVEIKKKYFTFTPSYSVVDLSSGNEVCFVRKHFFSFTNRFTITTPNGDYAIEGSFFAYNFKILSPEGREIVIVNKKWISWGDTYEIMVDTNEIPLQIAAAIIITIDSAIHSSSSNSNNTYQ